MKFISKSLLLILKNILAWHPDPDRTTEDPFNLQVETFSININLILHFYYFWLPL